MEYCPVSREVNSPAVDKPGNIVSQQDVRRHSLLNSGAADRSVIQAENGVSPFRQKIHSDTAVLSIATDNQGGFHRTTTSICGKGKSNFPPN